MIVWPSNSLLIKVKMNENIDSIFSNLNNNFAVLRVDTLFSLFFIIKIENPGDIFSISNQLFETGKYDFVRPSLYFITQFCGYEDNDFYPQQYYLKEYTDSLKGIDAVNAWEISTGNPNIRIAVLDNGVDRLHPDLNENVIYGGVDATTTNSSIIGSQGGHYSSD